ncbi:hypothetical protein [Phocaeicola sp.]|uniref:hypothetical protein n=1 Tax=Phocaeicola sp. TaxID=2773926 RepID=UPI0023CB47F2|nr:hypothetical protein [Phocaeicola sp.]MDE5676328.1 hypothetical protein [Phocaeicola sp.]
MKNIVLLLVLLFMQQSVGFAQEEKNIEYRRNSIYSVMIKHENQKFADTIASVFQFMPVPDKYNDHDLSVKVLSVLSKEVSPTEVESFLNKNGVASRLVSKWFNRDFTNGVCDVELIKERGLYDASEMDKAIALQTQRGKAMLEDAGEELIGNTFVLVNDIKYIDKGERSKTWGSIFKVMGNVAAIVTNNSSYADLGNNVGDITESYKGFKVKIYTHLYQLVWDEETAMTFYERMYTDTPDSEKHDAMELYRDKFKLKYVGSQLSDGSTTSFLGIKEDEPRLMVRKACQRALDDNVANLQKNYEAFKVKVPLLNVAPLTAQIGKKEGITEKSRFEVLEIQEKEGRTVYKRVGVIRPMSNLIWDNRFMAVEEKAEGASLKYTTFKKVSGGDFYPGMLIREIK